jgi:hypothetical protein
MERETNLLEAEASEPSLSLRYEEYHCSTLWGWQYHSSGSVSISSNLPMKEFYEKFKSLVDPWNQYDAICITKYSGWFQHIHDVCCLPLCNSCCCLCICCCCPSLNDFGGQVIKKDDEDIHGTVREVFVEQGNYLRFYRPRFRRGQHDIGVWVTHKIDFPGSSLLLLESNQLRDSKEFLSSPTFLSERFLCQTQLIAQLIAHYTRTSRWGDDNSKTGTVSGPHINQCSEEISHNLLRLREVIEESYQQTLQSSSSSSPVTDFQLSLTSTELESTLGVAVTSQLSYYFLHEEFPPALSDSSAPSAPSQSNRQIDQILLRRSSVPSSSSQCIPFHVDNSFRTMQISLSSGDDHEGGELLYLVAKDPSCSSSYCLLPKREVGTIMIHERGLVHGVREMKSGVRYGLFFIQKSPPPPPSERGGD